MCEQYYRVKLEWPVPHFCKKFIDHSKPINTVYDGRFYTTATDLRGVHLDIQAHLAKHYALEGLNEFEEHLESFKELRPQDILAGYNPLQQPKIHYVEIIDDPEQVESIGGALEQIDMVKTFLKLIAMGFIPTPGDWGSYSKTLHELIEPLENAVKRVLQIHEKDEDNFLRLNDLLDQTLAITRELNYYTKNLIKQAKG